MKKYFLLFCVSILLSCEGKLPEKKQDKIYVISKDTSYNFIGKEDYYTGFNLILGDSNKIYLFQGPRFWNCVPTDNPPYFINLEPSDIIELPYENIDDFIKLNKRHHSAFSDIYNIVSPYDSIKSKAFEKIMQGFASVKQKKYIIRRTTFEENQLLFHKINHLNYDPKEINWDTTKVHFNSKEDIDSILKVSQQKFKK